MESFLLLTLLGTTALERFDALTDRELKELVKTAYQLVREKLPKKIQAQLK
jgi:predicted DNA-binding protein (MmcQ/YjbR family)